MYSRHYFIVYESYLIQESLCYKENKEEHIRKEQPPLTKQVSLINWELKVYRYLPLSYNGCTPNLFLIP